MKVLVFFLSALALGSGSPIGSETSELSREDRIKTAIDNNVEWLLSGIKNGNLEGSDLARAVVALYLAKPEYFAVGHEIGQQLKSNVEQSMISLITLQQGVSNIPTEELALYVQALTVTCEDVRSPRRFMGRDLTLQLFQKGLQSQWTGRFPSNAFLAVCNADATHLLTELFESPFKYINLTDEEAFTQIAIDCFQSYFPWNIQGMQMVIHKSGYQYYPSNLTVEKLQELMNPDDGETPSLSAIAAAMQTLMHIRRLGVSDLPSVAVDFLLDNQDEDGSWGQSAFNSFFVLPALSSKSFRDIDRQHCPRASNYYDYEADEEEEMEFAPSREDRIKTAIDNNVEWLLSGIKNGNLEGSDLARAVVALFLAKPEYFAVGHEIGQQLKSNVTQSMLSLITLQQGVSNIPTEELALYVQALTVSCYDVRSPRRFFGHDLTKELFQKGLQSQWTGRFPSNAFLAVCNADATHLHSELDQSPFKYINLTDEEAFTQMAIDCFKSHFPWNVVDLHMLVKKSGYQYYPSNLTVEKLQEMMYPDYGEIPPLSAIAAAMQTLMHIRRLRVSDLPSVAVDFLLDNQDDDGSWGQSAINSFFVLPALSSKSFRDINKNHCPSTPYDYEADEKKEPELKLRPGLSMDEFWEFYGISPTKYVLNIWDPTLQQNYSNSLYDYVLNYSFLKAVYLNGTNGKPYLHSLRNRKNRPEEGYVWNTYEIAPSKNIVLTRLKQSHADITVRRGDKYVLSFSRARVQDDISLSRSPMLRALLLRY